MARIDPRDERMSGDSAAQPLSLQTSVPGAFAVGDVRSGSVKRVGAAIGESAGAVAQLRPYLADRRREPVQAPAQAPAQTPAQAPLQARAS
jgi:thioredoxin reductase (NADPH)